MPPVQQRNITVKRIMIADASPAAASGGALLKDLDSFLTLARLAPGPVALHCPSTGLGAEVLAAALLVQRHGFDGRAVLAWLCKTHPPVAVHRAPACAAASLRAVFDSAAA
jgi:hypothetical protein